MKKFCPNCGAQLKENATFCPQCGTKLVEPKKSQQPVEKDIDTDKKADTNKQEKPKDVEQPKPAKAEKVQVFCPNCGHPIKQGATFCNNCGYNLVTKQMPAKTARPSQPAPTQPVQQQVAPKQHKPMKLGTKIILSVIGVLIVALIGFYAWG